MRNGTCSERPTWARRIDASGSSSWPTARATDAQGGAYSYSRGDRNSPHANLSGVARLWLTPDANAINSSESPESFEARRVALKAKGMNGNGAGTPLGIAAQQWATPTSHDRTHSPREVDHGAQLANQVSLWSTPTSRDWKNDDPNQSPDHSPPLGRQVLQLTRNGDASSRAVVLNPSFVETLMGFPIGWTDCALSATPSCRRSRRSRSDNSLGG